MWFVLADDFLAYAGEVEGLPQPDSKNPVVVSQGLRSCDCLELFLCEPNSPRYQEFNLGPDGKWWTCAFSDIRVREALQPLSAKAETFAEIRPDSWRAAFRLPLSELLINFDPGHVRYNLSAIVGPPEAQSFPSLADIAVQEPDFHQPRYFVLWEK